MNVVAALTAAVLLFVSSPARGGQAKLHVVASFLPLYVFTLNVAQGAPGVSVDVLVPPSRGGPHGYSLTPGDLRKIASADLFIANGFGLEKFLGSGAVKAVRGVRIVETARAVRPLYAAGAGGRRGEVNPHTWVSPSNAVIQVRAIEKALSEASPQNAPLFRRNADAYAARLSALAQAFQDASKHFRKRNIVTFHNAFDYLARDLGLTVVGRIEETPGQEPSAGELAALIRTIREKHVAAVFAEPQYSARLADVVAAEAGVPVRLLDPAVTGPDGPTAYEDVMRKNLRTLTEVLGSP